ncbi:MAG: metallopeptidase, partial [Candidatus Diapherotrites archaeon]|uniref:Metallopeptidase n=1 Tax=Candidatus Iainarchaeum sp. TaxID=3101447 RepID=A0A7J4JYL7_9ARCH|nr:metallopeptidase [Candidatus Diapherotrites archaeon]HIH21355.1 metallopeptidase [Candidatus Diapherotrites archaeon]HIH33012.1 metallopeptidase [Candidatus Diapherotrites archaeon]
MKYYFSQELTEKAGKIARELEMQHIVLERIACVKSTGSKSKRTIARIHTLGKVMQLGMQEKPFYTIEFISENFDKQGIEEQEKTIIHELMHIPAGFKGGFRQHKPFVTGKKVEEMWEKLKQNKNSP